MIYLSGKNKEQKECTMIYVLKRIDGDYAYLADEASGEELFIAMALLPEGVDVGTRIKYENFEFSVI